MVTRPAEQYLRQLALAGKVEVEYHRRLAAAGYKLGEGAMHDCLEVSSAEEAAEVQRIFQDTCKEFGLC